MFLRPTRGTRAARPARTVAASLAVTAGTTAAVLVLAGAPAGADTTTFRDAAGDMTSGQQVHPGDVERVTVVHETRLRVTVRHHDLRRDGDAGARLFIDTRPARRGPELVLTAGLHDGTDYALVRARGWRPVGEHLTCFHRLGLDYAQDRSRFVIGRSCLGAADEVRVALRVSGPTGEPVDWLKGRRTFTRSVAR